MRTRPDAHACTPLSTSTLEGRIRRSIPLASIVDVTARTAGIGIDDSDLTITYITSPRLRAHTVEYSTMTFTFNKSFDIAGLYRHLMTIAQRNYASLNDA